METAYSSRMVGREYTVVHLSNKRTLRFFGVMDRKEAVYQTFLRLGQDAGLPRERAEALAKAAYTVPAGGGKLKKAS